MSQICAYSNGTPVRFDSVVGYHDTLNGFSDPVFPHGKYAVIVPTLWFMLADLRAHVGSEEIFIFTLLAKAFFDVCADSDLMVCHHVSVLGIEMDVK